MAIIHERGCCRTAIARSSVLFPRKAAHAATILWHDFKCETVVCKSVIIGSSQCCRRLVNTWSSQCDSLMFARVRLSASVGSSALLSVQHFVHRGQFKSRFIVFLRLVLKQRYELGDCCGNKTFKRIFC